MKKLILISTILLGVILAFTVLYLLFSKPSTTPKQGVSFPTASSTDSQTTLSSGQVTIRNFLRDTDTKADLENPGYYYSGYQTYGDNATKTPPFLVEYIADTGYFNITLTAEPVGERRLEVEKYLEHKLGLTKDQMCKLNYAVYVPYSVNESFAGTNLEFSFCPGATQLPF